MKILVAVDGSPFTKRMLAYLTAHDEFPGQGHQYTVLHTVAPVPARAAAVIDKPTLDAFYKDGADTRITVDGTDYDVGSVRRVEIKDQSTPTNGN